MMPSKKAIAVLLICLVIAMASVKKAETLSDCAKECMPVCLKEKGATIDTCSPACEKYCVQITEKATKARRA
ncbi:hypothetical protein MtrunA17_Chr1g0170831 [Medicago truncatula]|uniref:Thionin related/ Pollen Ole e 6 n=1 Tax=Medicago truncatula TaxID=3880 RepID=A0A072VHW4_MEDTR|nr:Thionin related/ Pollen Ole e 6 [Medicago truncatula]RHN78886.1 hypothetical protein MtrunA17_Chr1g0170831 [Medicago truncatula]